MLELDDVPQYLQPESSPAVRSSTYEDYLPEVHFSRGNTHGFNFPAGERCLLRSSSAGSLSGGLINNPSRQNRSAGIESMSWVVSRNSKKWIAQFIERRREELRGASFKQIDRQFLIKTRDLFLFQRRTVGLQVGLDPYLRPQMEE